jgi:hypothetical protein
MADQKNNSRQGLPYDIIERFGFDLEGGRR